MRRLLLAACLALPTSAWAIVPPIPRVAPGLLPPGDDKPAEPKPDAPPPAAADDDPLKTIERITQTAKAVGDRLKDTDTGEDTRKQQDQLLRDIDSLLKSPPPQGGGGGGGGSPPPPMGGGGGGGGSPPPMGGGKGGGGSGRKQRGSGGQGQQQQQPMGGAGQQQQQPMGDGGKPDKPMGQGQPTGGANDPTGSGTPQTAGAQGGKGGGKMTPDLPLDDPFSKRVWGHLPEKLRQQAMQSYREQFMPQYSELLKQYYSNIAEREKGTTRK